MNAEHHAAEGNQGADGNACRNKCSAGPCLLAEGRLVIRRRRKKMQVNNPLLRFLLSKKTIFVIVGLLLTVELWNLFKASNHGTTYVNSWYTSGGFIKYPCG